MKKRCFLTLLCLMPTLCAAEENLGRLFHSAQQREQLTRLRQQKFAVDPENIPLFIFNGEVRRSSGQHTHWINAQAHTGQRPSHLQQTPVGDHIEMSNGTAQSLLGEGKLLIKRPAP